VAKKNSGQMKLFECKYEDRILVISGEPSGMQDIEGTFDFLKSATENLAWWWGDAYNYSSERWGEEAAQLLPDPKKTPKTLATWCHVCRSFPPGTRVYDLPFTHYAEVVGCDPEKRAELLSQAETEGWTSSQLRRIVKPQGGRPEKICECPNCHAELKIEGSMLMIAEKVVTIDDPEDEREAA
jgi:hypothetical protein